MMIILASASPRRREILELMGCDFEVCPTDADESVSALLTPEETVKTLARRKYDALSGEVMRAHSITAVRGDVAVAADTIVWLPEGEGGHILGKPHDEKRAFEMLRSLSGREHYVFTGVCAGRVVCGEKSPENEPEVFAVSTKVCFRELSDAEIRRYIERERPFDKAGAYGIQGGAAIFVSGIEGDYYNVVGLPATALYTVLRDRFGLFGE